MTCTKNCSDCLYGVPKKVVMCVDPYSTCNGDCQNCTKTLVKSIKWVCTRGIAYGVGSRGI